MIKIGSKFKHKWLPHIFIVNSAIKCPDSVAELSHYGCTAYKLSYNDLSGFTMTVCMHKLMKSETWKEVKGNIKLK